MIKTREEANKLVDLLLEKVLANDDLIRKISKEEFPPRDDLPLLTKPWHHRAAIVEEYIMENSERFGIDSFDYLWAPGIRETFFYKLQDKLDIDFGICEYFLPTLLEKPRGALSAPGEWNKCTYEGKYDTTCHGFARDFCVILRSFRSKRGRRKNVPLDVDRAARKFAELLSKALSDEK
jgi:hypothetical protein